MTKARPFERPVLSEPAQRWIGGDLESTAYFTSAHDDAEPRARAEVLARLERNHGGRRAGRPSRPSPPPR